MLRAIVLSASLALSCGLAPSVDSMPRREPMTRRALLSRASACASVLTTAAAARAELTPGDELAVSAGDGVKRASGGGGECQTTSNPAITSVKCTRFGVGKDGRLRGCSALENCASSSAVRSPSKFVPPWSYADVARLREQPERAWLQLTRAVEAVGGDGVVVVERDDDRRYLHVTAPSKVPPGSLDDVEFRLDAETRAVYVRSATRESIFVYPLQQPLSDAGTNMARLVRIRDELAWEDVGYDRERAAASDSRS